MEEVAFQNAFYIKLGQGGKWENESIDTGLLRFGWWDVALEDINAGRWSLIKEQLQRRGEQAGRSSEATRGFNGLRYIAESGPNDVWITFNRNKLWWARLASSPVEEDATSKFRRTAGPWRDTDVKGQPLFANQLPGKLAQTQAFRWTVCRAKYPDILLRTLNATRSELAAAISSDRAALKDHLTEAIRQLHWKDFETLVDLVFRSAGWRRVSVLGEQAKGYDLLLQEPITDDRYVIQVKSRAGLTQLQETVVNFSADDYRGVYFVVHSPDSSLASAVDLPEHVVVMPPEVLAEQAVDAGLVGWLEDKVR